MENAACAPRKYAMATRKGARKALSDGGSCTRTDRSHLWPSPPCFKRSVLVPIARPCILACACVACPGPRLISTDLRRFFGMTVPSSDCGDHVLYHQLFFGAAGGG